MTPPTARKRPVAARPSTLRPSAVRAAEAEVVTRFVGADRMVQEPGRRVLPAGVTHVVDGWQPVCGEPRVKFVFPGVTLDDAPEVCDACAAGGFVRRVPRQRRASSA